MRIQEVQKHTDPTDPDPEHCSSIPHLSIILKAVIHFVKLYVRYVVWYGTAQTAGNEPWVRYGTDQQN